MPLKKRYIQTKLPLLSRNQKIAVAAISFLVGYALVLFFWQFVLIPRQKARKVTTQSSTASFDERAGKFGAQEYRASVRNYTSEGGRRVLPIAGCWDFLVIDLKFKEKDPINLQRKLEALEGVSVANIFPNKIVVNRPCVSTVNFTELWPWEEVWEKVKPILENHYK